MDPEVLKKLLDESRKLEGNCQGVYFLFDGEELVYVGKSWNCLLRIAEHTGVFQHSCRVIYPVFSNMTCSFSGFRLTNVGKSQFLVSPLQRFGFLALAAA